MADVLTDSDAVQWLTYAEIAAALGITRESARQLVIRKRWKRSRGNDGKARIGVPLVALPSERTSRAPSDRTSDGTSHHPSPHPSAGTSDHPSEISRNDALLRTLDTLRASLARAEAAADREQARAETASERARLAEIESATVPALRDTIARLESELDPLRSMPAQVAALRAVLDAVRDERDRVLTREHLREQRRFWRRLVGG